MRTILFSIFVFYSICTFSQTVIKATIKDSKTREILAYCNVSIKGTYKGTITNADGIFTITANISDVLVFSYLGYETKSIQAVKLIKNPVVSLVKKDFILQEATVHASNDYLYNILAKCRKKLLAYKANKNSKVYYGLETRSKTLSVEYLAKTNITHMPIKIDPNEKPVELLECFYNGYLKGIKLEKLRFKNGRTALAAIDNYFLTLNTSKAISKIILTVKNDDFPSIPFQYNKDGMKKHFIVEMQYFDDNSYNLKFYPKDKAKDRFSGEVLIERKTHKLQKIILLAENTNSHPFLPIIPSLDSIYNVSFNITNTYININDGVLPNYIYFNYSFTYLSRRDTIVQKTNYKRLKREINSKGIMYFYDYDHPFILPYFEYSHDVDDYYKMSFIPYNEYFWNNNSTLIYTQKQKKIFDFLSKEGQLINYRKGNYGYNFLRMLPNFNNKIFREYYYSFWSSEKRVIPNKNSAQFKTFSKEIINSCIQRDLYNLKIQILLDITELNDSLFCSSYTVFDNAETFFHLPLNENTNAFINIFFDICEIERRKMQAKLDVKKYTKEEIDTIYKTSLKNMEAITKRYLNEVDLGYNKKLFNKWNQYVFENLNIDNIAMVEKTLKK